MIRFGLRSTSCFRERPTAWIDPSRTSRVPSGMSAQPPERLGVRIWPRYVVTRKILIDDARVATKLFVRAVLCQQRRLHHRLLPVAFVAERHFVARFETEEDGGVGLDVVKVLAVQREQHVAFL